MEDSKRILLVDDDIQLCLMLKSYLETDSLRVDCLHDGSSALAHLLGPEAICYDLLILDVMLPGRSGVDVLRVIRESGLDIPVLMLSGRGASANRIEGLEAGADDYVSKPCDPREIEMRIAAILRRSGGRDGRAVSDRILHVEDLELDHISRTVRIGGHLVDLTDVEFRLLKALLKNLGEVVSLESLFRDVLKRDYTPGDRIMNTHACRLRRKLGRNSNGSDRIKASRLRGFSYICPGIVLQESKDQ